MTIKTYYNIKLIRAALASVPSEINPEIIEAAPETAPAARLDSCQIRPGDAAPAGLALPALYTSYKGQKTI